MNLPESVINELSNQLRLTTMRRREWVGDLSSKCLRKPIRQILKAVQVAQVGRRTFFIAPGLLKELKKTEKE